MAPPRVVNIADLRRGAKRRLPRAVFDYIDGGADSEMTLRGNCQAFDDLTWRPRCAVAMTTCELRTTVLGTPIELPLLLAPVGSSRVFFPRGEAVAAHAAGWRVPAHPVHAPDAAGGRQTASSGPVWYQLYLLGGRDVATAAIARAGRRNKPRRHHHTPVAGLRGVLTESRSPGPACGQAAVCIAGLTHCAAASFLAVAVWWGSQRGAARRGSDAVRGRRRGPRAPTVSWPDLKWIRTHGRADRRQRHPPGEDARRAVDVGADALVVPITAVVSDGVAPPLRVLPSRRRQRSGRVLMDGVRRGSGIASTMPRRAPCCRASVCVRARAGGGPGSRAIEILRTDLIRTPLLGCGGVAERIAPWTFRLIGPAWQAVLKNRARSGLGACAGGGSRASVLAAYPPLLVVGVLLGFRAPASDSLFNAGRSDRGRRARVACRFGSRWRRLAGARVRFVPDRSLSLLGHSPVQPHRGGGC